MGSDSFLKEAAKALKSAAPKCVYLNGPQQERAVAIAGPSWGAVKQKIQTQADHPQVYILKLKI